MKVRSNAFYTLGSWLSPFTDQIQITIGAKHEKISRIFAWHLIMQIIQSYILVLHLGCDEEEENNNISDNKGLAKILLYKPELMK